MWDVVEREWDLARHTILDAKVLDRNVTSPTTLHCDNQAAIHLATDDNYHARTKHIDIQFHFIRQTIIVTF